jgi:hypothetical protein
MNECLKLTLQQQEQVAQALPHALRVARKYARAYRPQL